MSSKSPHKSDFSRKIIKHLSTKPLTSLESLRLELTGQGESRTSYALTRSLRNLRESGLISEHSSGQQTYARLTPEGRRKAHSIHLDHEHTLYNPYWDKKWRIVMLDFPEDRKSERDAMRYLLKKAGFALVKNGVWISQQPFEHLFSNIKKDLSLATEVFIIVTDSIDSETEREFLRLFG